MITPTVGCRGVPACAVLNSSSANAAKRSISDSATGPLLAKRTRPVVVPSLVHDSDESAAEPPSHITTVDKRTVDFDKDCVVDLAASLVRMLRQEKEEAIAHWSSARPSTLGVRRVPHDVQVFLFFWVCISFLDSGICLSFVITGCLSALPLEKTEREGQPVGASS